MSDVEIPDAGSIDLKAHLWLKALLSLLSFVKIQYLEIPMTSEGWVGLCVKNLVGKISCHCLFKEYILVIRLLVILL
jgi:hypothetical protein